MEQYTHGSFRELREEMLRARRQRRGSILITLLIIALFAAAGLFYVKTAQPALWNKAAAYVKDAAAGGKSLETISRALFGKAKNQQQAETENKTGESGDMLLTADNLTFNYISEPVRCDLLGGGKAAVSPPVVGATVTSDFGARTDPVTGEADAGHHGVDLAAPVGSDIFAYADGVVAETGESEIYGNYVLIDHGGGLNTFYGHMSKVTVSKGESVAAGDSIGVIGSTGKSTGTHLHFEMRYDGERVDPMPYIYEKI